MSRSKKLVVPEEWTFRSAHVAETFDRHVREQLPWYDLATGAVAHIARHYVPQGGKIVDVGASTGNIGRALAPMLKLRSAILVAVDQAAEMKERYRGPGDLVVSDAETFDYDGADLIVCFLCMMFVPVRARMETLARMAAGLRPGGAVIVFDKMLPRPGWLGTVNYRLTLAAKYENGATAEEIIAKELSLGGLQRPMSEDELASLGFVEVFRFGDFAGFVLEK